jgi:hypothetical protein
VSRIRELFDVWMIERNYCSQQVLSLRGPGVDQIPYSRMWTDSDCSWTRCCLQTRDVSCEMTLSNNDGLCHLGTLGIKAKHFTVRGLFVAVLTWAVGFGESRDCGMVELLADGHRNTMRSYLSVIRFGADSRWSGLQRQPNPVVSAVGGISYSFFLHRKGPLARCIE